MSAWTVGCLLGAGAAVAASAPPTAGRLTRLRPAPAAAPSLSTGGSSGDHPPGARPWAAVVLDVSVLVLVVTLLPGAVGPVLAVPAVVGAHRWVTRLPSRARLADRAAARRQLPLVLELVAAGLRSGATTETAVTLAADAAGPGVAAVLREVVAGLRLGAPAEEAWRPALALEGFDRLARAAMRSATSGATLAAACSELARRERRLRNLEAQASVKRAGVWAVLPLALCFLPAFALLGVVPVVVGLLQAVTL